MLVREFKMQVSLPFIISGSKLSSFVTYNMKITFKKGIFNKVLSLLRIALAISTKSELSSGELEGDCITKKHAKIACWSPAFALFTSSSLLKFLRCATSDSKGMASMAEVQSKRRSWLNTT